MFKYRVHHIPTGDCDEILDNNHLFMGFLGRWKKASLLSVLINSICFNKKARYCNNKECDHCVWNVNEYPEIEYEIEKIKM